MTYLFRDAVADTMAPVMLNEAKTSRPRPRPSQIYEAEAKAEANFWRSRPRPKIIMTPFL